MAYAENFADSLKRLGYDTEWVNGRQVLKLPSIQPASSPSASSSPWAPINTGPAPVSSSPWAPVGSNNLPNYGAATTQPVSSAVAASGTGSLQAPSFPALPDYTPQTSLDLANISSLLNPSYADMDEVKMKAAANAASQGTTGSAFAYNGLLKMLDSEKIARQQLGSTLLQPYLSQKTQLQTAEMAQQGENYRAILAGNQAMERLQLSEAGLTARLTQSEQAALQQTVLQGQQALERISLGGQYGLASTNLNPLTQQKLAQNLTGNGSALENARAVIQRYGGAGGGNIIPEVSQGQFTYPTPNYQPTSFNYDYFPESTSMIDWGANNEPAVTSNPLPSTMSADEMEDWFYYGGY